jgi:thiol-disulfide isomerase/thioredoxin
MMPDVSESDKAPDFLGMLPTGKSLRLSDLRGQYVLIDFWGSWCGPCLRQFPHWEALDTRYRGSRFEDAAGFRIVAIGVEADAARWAGAIERYRMDWADHLLDPSSSLRFFDSPIARSYGVRQLPSTFLIGPAGRILAVNPDPGWVDRFLAGKLRS